ncbi:bifunctional phosphopantothenoylcysteine decarboxylase/phosphopantothenate--cysteine ligase CoaBC [Nakamurella sp. A5-74]|uniref:Coenzyme A biosynthesis bifunctional protein CoaBC n=1 Tax=Nakamurella sp. A5-74 TaxID=3158264 RepID=A0AAU8DK11_9ACTN
MAEHPQQKRVVVGVSGGIAAYKACELIRRIRADDHDVTVVPTASALSFVGAATFEALSGNPVTTEVFQDIPQVRHVALGQQADLVVIAPATADLIARAAAGRADDLLTATLLVTRAPVLLAPAMHTEMWTHPATVANVATLRDRGTVVVPPAVGRLTGADSGPGRLPEPEQLAQLVQLLLHRPGALPQDLVGRRIVVSAGGTREPLDPVRFLGNRSSGRQGYAIALVAAARGAEVTLVSANAQLVDPPGVRTEHVGTAAELQAAVVAATRGADAVVMNAAVADFRPTVVGAHKIKKRRLAVASADGAADAPDHGTDPGAVAVPTIELTENPDVLAGLVDDRGTSRTPVIVGFAAETGDERADAIQYGRDKLRRKGCDALVVNRVDAGQAFESDDNAAVVLAADPQLPDLEIPFGPKTLVAAAVCDRLAMLLGASH